MMFGIELRDQGLAGLCLALLYRRNVTSTYSLYNNFVVRVQPPMTIAEPDLHEGLRVLRDVLQEVERYRKAHQHERPGASVDHEFLLPTTVAAAADVLAQAARALDPFCLDARQAPNREPIELVGTLGGEPLR
jgi:hypothetical protein